VAGDCRQCGAHFDRRLGLPCACCSIPLVAALGPEHRRHCIDTARGVVVCRHSGPQECASHQKPALSVQNDGHHHGCNSSQGGHSRYPPGR